MKRFIISALAATAFVQIAAAQSIGGSYSVQGTNHNGSTYKGDAEITLTSDTTCEIVWVTGGTTSKGICSRNGSAFAAAYVLGTAVGLVIYQLQEDGSMKGLWTIAGQSGTGTEDLTPK